VLARSRRIGRFLRSQLFTVLFCSLYVIVFVYAYKLVIVPLWEYEGFHSRTTSSRAAVGWLLAVLPSLWLPVRLKRPSMVVYWLLYLLVIVPACLVPIYALDDQSAGPIILVVVLVAAFAVTGVIYTVPLISVPHLSLRSYEFKLLLAFISIACFALIISTFGFTIRYVSFEDTYTVRGQFSDAVRHASPLVGYAIAWQAWVINPLVMAIGLRSRRVSWVLLGAAGEFAIYSITAFRAMFFAAALLLYLLWAMRTHRAFGIRLAGSWAAIVAVASASQPLGFGLVPVSLVGVRMIALPGLLTGYYYEFFSSHPQAHLGHSILKSLVSYPYAVEPPYLIGALYFHNTANDANANVWADAYANFGYLGILGYTVLLAMVLWLYDSVASGHDRRLAALVIALPSFALANGSLLTTFLTNGIGLAILLLYLMPTEQRNEAIKSPYWYGVAAEQ
jgi:hypothetical protein